jgi:glycosyltransferase involved in cell wall biosynthesis
MTEQATAPLPRPCTSPTVPAQPDPLVSVVMIFWQAERFIDEAIESVRAQTYPCWELILVDDGSTDRSTEAARRYAETEPDRIRYVTHPRRQNLGMSASRNLGIAHARGEFIALLDADDVWLPSKLAEQVPVLVAQPALAMVYGPTEWWYSWTGRSEDRGRDFVHELGVPANAPIRAPTLLVRLLADEGVSPCTCSMLIRRDVLERVGGFEDGFRGLYEDQVLCAKICLDFFVLAMDRCSYRYRQHDDSAVAYARRSGTMTDARRAFLAWLEAWLHTRGVVDQDLWGVLERERRQLERGGALTIVERARSFARCAIRSPSARKGGHHP